jgi:hypothetical protein
VKRGSLQEEELVLHPAFFTALRRHLPEIQRVDIQLKRGRYQNELSQFRYDVTLHTSDVDTAAAAPVWLDWQRDELTLSRLRELISNTGVRDPGRPQHTESSCGGGRERG